jgi:hypothetical protein
MKLPRFKSVDVVFYLTAGPSFLWPLWTQHGGPPAPKDLGTVVMGIVGIYGTTKALAVKPEKTHKPKHEEDDEETPE